MSRIDPARLFMVAWRVVPRLPGPLARGFFDVAAMVAHALRGPGVVQLERNLARLRPDATPAQLRRLSRAGMRSYLRYYCEAFQLPGLSQEQIDARVRATGHEDTMRRTRAGEAVVLALGHAGNWDIAGAWANRHLQGVVTVAERLKPDELFERFIGFRESLGMVIVPHDRGGSTFRALLRELRRPGVVPLLADRDLSHTGVDVPVGGAVMRVAPGPAALALARKLPLIPVFISYERLHGVRRRAAASPWGIHIEFLGEVSVPESDGADARDQTAALTRAWFSRYFERLTEHPTDWHMLQKVFTDDLDPQRSARAQGEVRP